MLLINQEMGKKKSDKIIIKRSYLENIIASMSKRCFGSVISNDSY